MALIKCKMCGGDLRIEEGSTVCECEYCGTRQTVPSADNEKKLTLFSRAGRLLRGCEFDKAAGVFETIVADFPEEAEAYWGLVLCKYGIEYVDDPATGKKIPTCHRSSFDSVLDDPNYEQACENTDAVARRVYRDEARQIEDLRKRIIEVSGKEEPYDVFISYKETDEHGDRTLDSVIAQDIYTELTEKGYRVFFSRISLEDKLGTEYEPYIFAALNSAKVMLVVGTDYENFDSVWVKNEWSRFLKLIASGQKKTLIPVFKNMDAYDMPKEFAKLAAQDMGKVGAMQDLVRGVEKLINKKAAPVKETVKETVVVQQSGDSVARITAAMDRGFMALEDGEWDKAVSFFDQVLSLDAKNARAYYGMALAKAQCKEAAAYIDKLCAFTPKSETIDLPVDEEHIRKAAEKYAVPGYLSSEKIKELYNYTASYQSTERSQKQLNGNARSSFEKNRDLTRARQFATGEVMAELDQLQKALFERLDSNTEAAAQNAREAKAQAEKEYKRYLESKDKLAEEMNRKAEGDREDDYQAAIKGYQRANSSLAFHRVKPLFLNLASYKNSAEMAERCQEEASRLAREEAQEAERKRKAEVEEAEQKRKAEAEEAERQRVAKEKAEKERMARNKRLTIAAVLIVALAVAAYFTYTKVIVPSNAYRSAEALYEAGQYDQAIAAFKALGDYKDSTGRIEDVREEIRAQDYAAAEALLEAGDTLRAAITFGSQGDYKDARVRSLTCWNKSAKLNTIVAGFNHTAGLHSDGTVVAVGSNVSGQCEVSGWANIVAIAAGGNHTVGLHTDGTVVAVGSNSNSQCEVSGWANIVAIAAGENHTVGLCKDGTVVAVGSNDYNQCEVSGWANIIAIAAGDNHTVGLRMDGTVVAVGSNNYSQCEVSSWTNIVAIAAGSNHTVGLYADGTTVAKGFNNYRQCDVHAWTDIVYIAAGSNCTVGIRADGTVYGVVGLKNVVSVAVGRYHTVGLREDGTVVATGMNEMGQCDVYDWRNIKVNDKR